MFARKLVKSLVSPNSGLFTISPAIQPIRLISENKSNVHSNGKQLIAVCQLNSKFNKDENFLISKELIHEASSYGCSMAFLPENCDAIPNSKEDIPSLMEPIDGPLITKYRDLAKSCNIWLSIGSFHEKRELIDDGRKSNTSLVINNCGEIVAVYRKTHLFDWTIPGPEYTIESNLAIPGDKMVPPVQTPIGKLGLGICYDMSFPEFGLSLAKAGADVLSFPSMFSLEGGPVPWEQTLRCRAIETACYVVGAAQVGYHNKRRTSLGHSMVIDFRGNIIAQIGGEVGLAIAIIDPEIQHKAALERNLYMNHRRPELYGQIVTPEGN